MPERLAKKRKAILDHETGVARGIAFDMFPAGNLSVWEVLMPFLLIFSYVRRGQSRDWFEANLLVTKHRALEAAFDLANGHVTREEIGRRFEADTAKLLEANTDDTYGEPVRRAQIAEMEAFTDHYLRLLDASGETIVDLVRAAYVTESGFRRALGALAEAEAATIRASNEYLGERGDPEFAARLADAFSRIRTAQVERVFGPDAAAR